MANSERRDDGTVRMDRRRRNAHDLTLPITVNMPVTLKDALDAAVATRGGTRSGAIRIAIRAWLDRQGDAPAP